MEWRMRMVWTEHVCVPLCVYVYFQVARRLVALEGEHSAAALNSNHSSNGKRSSSSSSRMEHHSRTE